MSKKLQDLADEKALEYIKEKFPDLHGQGKATPKKLAEMEQDFANGFIAGFSFRLDVQAEDYPSQQTVKQAEAQAFVDDYIKKHDIAPTYSLVAKAFGIKPNAAITRLKYYKHRMKYNRQ